MKTKIPISAKLLLILFLTFKTFYGSAQSVTLKLHLHGIVESKVSLLPLSGENALKTVIEKQGIKNEVTDSIIIPNAYLPGEFVLRFDYKEKENSTPYPCEKYIIINNQDLELWINPMYCNNNDSSYFQKDEKENMVFAQFIKENNIQKEKLGLLQNFLLNYDDTQSKFYQQGIEEFEKRRSQYNQWLTEQITQQKDLFVSHTFQFQFVPQIAFTGNENARMQNVLSHYFDGIDFRDTLLLHTQGLNDFITNYVNMYASIATTQAELDSLYPLIGKTAIEKARFGNPKVYGWMVDYFYRGYESNGIDAGIKILEPYLNDPTCLTTKRQAIEKRLKGMKTLVVGTLAPDFTIKNDAGEDVLFSKYKTNRRYKLLLFWSADCGHCKELISEIYQWYEQLSDKNLVEVFALSLDETETEIMLWQKTITQLPNWKHINCEGGINSKEANAYFILSVPAMFLVDAKTNKICAIPLNTDELKQSLE
ncbi:MAG: redoxin domain-containing protein [Methanolobus sp.]|nr:redoxin domain-containing protein [Methanolobus sp.]